MCIRMRNATYTDFSDKERSKLRYSPSSLSTHGAALFISQNYNQRQSSKRKKMTATTAQVCSGFIFPASPNSHPPTPQPPSPLSLLSFLSFLPCCSPPLPSTHVHASSTLLCSIVKANLTPSSSFHLHFHFFFPRFFFYLSLSSFRASQPFTFFHSLSLSLSLYIYIYITLLLSLSFCCFTLTVCFSFVVVAVLFLASFTVCFVHFLPTLLCAHTHSPSHFFFFSALLLPCLAHRQRTSPHLHPSSPPRPCFLRR